MSETGTPNRAIHSALRRAEMRSEARNSSRLLSVTLMTVFFIALMGGLSLGALMYRNTARCQARARETHLQSGLIANIVRGGDVAGAVRASEGPEGPSLVLTRTLGKRSYETRLYLWEGAVVQEVAVAGSPYDPANATPLLATQAFSFTLDRGLLSFETDGGSFAVALRSDAGDDGRAAEDAGGDRAPAVDGGGDAR